ncbi:MAG: DUF4280 domain-containing protein [Clostridia bacterium]|nr:DUF4280 domain-containing protein [Clostridia bacterium]
MSSYVVQGATLKCSFGDKESQFKIPATHETYIKNKPQGNIMDFKPNQNILPFGMCSSLANPTVAAATAANKGVLKKMPCIPATVMPWINGKNDFLIENFPAMLNSSTTTCMWCGVIEITKDGQE